MVWTPQLNVFDDRFIRDNIIEFITDNQVEALAWADTVNTLPPIANFNKSVRLTTIFPSISFLTAGRATDFGDGDMMTIQMQVTMQLALVHGDQDILTDRAMRYAMALESMLANLPKTTFTENSYIGDVAAGAIELETLFDVQGRQGNRYIQLSETTAKWTLHAGVNA